MLNLSVKGLNDVDSVTEQLVEMPPKVAHQRSLGHIVERIIKLLESSCRRI